MISETIQPLQKSTGCNKLLALDDVGAENLNGSDETIRERALREEVGWEVAAWLALEGWPVAEHRTEWNLPNWTEVKIVLPKIIETNGEAISSDDYSLLRKPFRYE